MERPRGEAFGDADFGRRVVTGTVLAAVGLGTILLGGIAWLLLLIAAAVAMAYEYARLAERTARLQLLLFRALAAALVVVVAGAAAAGAPVGFGLLACAAVALALAGRLAGGRPAAWAGGAVYLAAALLVLWWLRSAHPDGAFLTFWIVAVVVATDTGGYFVGRVAGGPRLAPRISPGKTWSGLAGGVVLAAVTGGVLVALARGRADTTAILWGILAAALALVEQAGDLFESWLKRRAGYKDSGQLLPGHGGVLDRLDGLLFAAPAFGLVLWLTGRGGGS